MNLLRPVSPSDLLQLTQLVGNIADGLTSLPNNPDFLERRVHESARAFYPHIDKPGGEYYLFVLEDTETGRLLGTSGLISRVGGFDPFYTYEIRKNSIQYPPLEIENELQTLHLKKSHKGPSEICSLFLHSGHRSSGLGRLLSLSRFCFMKAFPKRFDTEIIAELRGFIDPSGQSPFWEAVGKRFFQKDYYSADVLSGLGDKDFIEALMPKFPIYYNLLPYSAQMVIGEVHPETEPALKLLMKEGFRKTNEVDIFDAGPLLKAKRESLRTWQLCKSAEPTVNDSIPDKFIPAIVTNHDLNFRAVLARIEVCEDGKVCLDKDTFNALKQPKAVQYVCLK